MSCWLDLDVVDAGRVLIWELQVPPCVWGQFPL